MQWATQEKYDFFIYRNEKNNAESGVYVSTHRKIIFYYIEYKKGI